MSMTKRIYNWKRSWYPTNKQPPLWESGFLRVLDESDFFFRQAHKVLATFEAINDCECLVLLGEPGMGKTKR